MEDLQSWWEVPSIAHFFHLFHSVLKLPDIQIEDLEEALLDDGCNLNGSPIVHNLLASLLSKCYSHQSVTSLNFQTYLRRLFSKKECSEITSDPNASFQSLSLREKVEILYTLCHKALDAVEVDIAKKIGSDKLRLSPIGYDSRKSAYWYFYGTRLYKEDFNRNRYTETCKKKKKNTSQQDSNEVKVNDLGSVGKWQVVCLIESDWEKVTKSFCNSTSKDERALYSVLSEDLMPNISKIFNQRHKMMSKQMMMLMPRRISSRIDVIKRQALEEKAIEEKKIQQEALKLKRREEIQKAKEELSKDRGLRLKLRALAAKTSYHTKSSSLKEQHSKNSLAEGTLQCSFKKNQALSMHNAINKLPQFSSKAYQNGVGEFTSNDRPVVVVKPLTALNSLCTYRLSSNQSIEHSKKMVPRREFNFIMRREMENENIIPY